jgi:hypothetical protein
MYNWVWQPRHLPPKVPTPPLHSLTPQTGHSQTRHTYATDMTIPSIMKAIPMDKTRGGRGSVGEDCFKRERYEHQEDHRSDNSKT